MNKDKQQEQRISEIMSSIEGIEKARPASFFYTRVKARLEQRMEATAFQRQPFWLRWFVQKQQWVAAGAFAIVLLNVGLILSDGHFPNSLTGLPSENKELFLLDDELESSFSYVYLFDD